MFYFLKLWTHWGLMESSKVPRAQGEQRKEFSCLPHAPVDGGAGQGLQWGGRKHRGWSRWKFIPPELNNPSSKPAFCLCVQCSCLSPSQPVWRRKRAPLLLLQENSSILSAHNPLDSLVVWPQNLQGRLESYLHLWLRKEQMHIDKQLAASACWNHLLCW